MSEFIESLLCARPKGRYSPYIISIFPTTPQGRYFCTHFTDQRDEVTCPTQVLSWALNSLPAKGFGQPLLWKQPDSLETERRAWGTWGMLTQPIPRAFLGSSLLVLKGLLHGRQRPCASTHPTDLRGGLLDAVGSCSLASKMDHGHPTISLSQCARRLSPSSCPR